MVMLLACTNQVDYSLIHIICESTQLIHLSSLIACASDVITCVVTMTTIYTTILIALAMC
jgi:hypothetical protein